MASKQIAVAVGTATVAAIAAVWLYRHDNERKHKSPTTSTSSSATANIDAKNVEKNVENNNLTIKSNDDDDIISREIDIPQQQNEQGAPLRDGDHRRILSKNTITIAYCSTTGTCAGFAKQLHQELLNTTLSSSVVVKPRGYKVQLIQVSDVDWWDELVNNEDDDDQDGEEDITASNKNTSASAASPPILLFILPTWTDGTLPPASQTLLTSLQEISSDWRVAPEPLRSSNPSSQLKIGAFGMGSSGYDIRTVGKPAKDVFSLLVGKLGARPLVSKNVGSGVKGGKKSKSLMIGDDEVGDASIVFDKWMHAVVASIFPSLWEDNGSSVKGKRKVTSKQQKKKKTKETTCDDGNEDSACACKSSDNAANESTAAAAGCCSSNNDNATDEAGCCSANNEDNSMTDSLSEDEEDDDDDDDDDDDSASEGSDGIIDLEDMGDVMKSQSSAMKSKEPQEMVTPKQAKALKKEGYKLIGTHSAVKLCRWTKHQLRGRGGCYKHTHYGITSYQCMEATPSLACANKCVFCWRHHKNPVGREWRWKTDDPKMIVREAINMHVGMIKETRGIPGIQMDRWTAAHTVRHCALSLVGEPIMYPKINELLGELHDRKISTYLVTNGQHPKAIEDLIPITQLYVSVDASTPESLEAIDRPLFRDAWDRLKSSLSCLKSKGQRTVARLTVVKGWNFDEIEGYARLIALGHCSLVEVKGVTFCGKSDASNLNMSNSPWHHEVIKFTKQLKKELDAIRAEGGDDPLPEYDLACEHKHSCSVLLARVDQFAVVNPEDPTKRKWRTWIDYDKFQILAAKHAADPTFKFGVEDYIEDTPSWAVFGADEEGFDPTDNRHRKKKKHPKYTQFDEEGIPTHDTFNEPLPADEIAKLEKIMEEKVNQIGNETTVTELQGGEKIIDDASLMFRGLVVSR